MPETDTLLPERPDTRPALGDIPGTLREIRAAVDTELREFRRYFRDSVRSDVNLLDKVTQYMCCCRRKCAGASTKPRTGRRRWWN